MPIRPIRIFGDPVLRTPARPVTSFDASLRRLVDDLMDTVAEPGRAGVAAPQIGVSLRAFSYDVDGLRGYLVNPEMVLTEGADLADEGCLSVPGLWFPTERAARAVARGVDVDGNPVTVEGHGELARCLQHEVDHLDGMLYLQRLSPERHKEARREIRRALTGGRPGWEQPRGISPSESHRLG